jgi:hypothetical protein
MKPAGHLKCVGEMRKAHTILLEKTDYLCAEGKWGDNIKTHLTYTVYDDVNHIQVAHDKYNLLVDFC